MLKKSLKTILFLLLTTITPNCQNYKGRFMKYFKYSNKEIDKQLYSSCHDNDYKKAEKLLKDGANPNTFTSYYNTCLTKTLSQVMVWTVAK